MSYNSVFIRIFNLSVLIIFSSFVLLCCAGTMSSKKERAQAEEKLGRSLFLDGNPREGLVHLLEAEKINPSSPELQHQLGLAYQKIGEFDLSLKHFKKAIKLNPEYPEVFNDMGILYSQQKEWDKALDCFKEAAANILYTSPHFAYHNIGTVYFAKENYSKAIENYEKSIKLAPDYIPPYRDLAELYISIDQQEKALQTYKEAISIAPQAWNIHLNLSRLYLEMGRRQEAIKQLNHIIITDPRSPYAKEAMKILNSIQ